MKDKLNVAIIGLGNFAKSVLLPAISLNDRLKLVHVAQHSSVSSSSISNLDHPFCSLASIDEICCSPLIDLIIIATPPSSHFSIASQAIKSKKIVMCEKPVGTSSNEIRILDQLAHKHSVKTIVDFSFRYDPGMLALRELVKDEVIGNIEAINIVWRTSGAYSRKNRSVWKSDPIQGGVTSEYAIHCFDYIHWLTSNSVLNINQYSKTFTKVDSSSANHSKNHDELCAFLELDSGICCTLNISNSFNYNHGHAIDVYGSKGLIRYHHSPPFSFDSYTISISSSSGTSTKLLKVDGLVSTDTRVMSANSMFNDIYSFFINNIRPINLPSLDDAYFASLLKEKCTNTIN